MADGGPNPMSADSRWEAIRAPSTYPGERSSTERRRGFGEQLQNAGTLRLCCVPLAACDWLTTIRSRWMDRSIVSCCQCAAMVLRYFHGLFEAEIGQSQYRSSDSKGCLRCLGSSRRRCRGLVFLEVVRISVRPFHFQTPAHLLGFQPRQDSPRSPPRTGRGISRI
jgi:hypothetical protein